MSKLIKIYKKIVTLFFVGFSVVTLAVFSLYLRTNRPADPSLGYSGKPIPIEETIPLATITQIITPTPIATKKPLYLGFSVEPVNDQSITEISELVGNKQSIINVFLQWGNPGNSRLTPEFFQVFTRRGVTPMITWEPWVPGAGVDQPDYSLTAINSGKHDGYIRQSAAEIKRYGQPVFLRLAHEMNGNWYPWSGTVNNNTPELYVATWKHVYEIFRSENVTNVTWVWCPNAGSFPATLNNDLTKYYPGDEYTDWIALDGYNWGSYQNSSGWHSFDQIFGSSYAKLVSLTNKPIMIAEVGSNEAGGQKDVWLKQFLSPDLATKYPQIYAVVFFNLNKEVDWRIQSSSNSLKAFLDSAAKLSFAKKVSLSGQKIIPSK